MPEGHTIHRIARDHRKRFVGEQTEVSSPQGRFEEGAAELDGHKLVAIEAHGKHLFYFWGPDALVHIHLGLYGKFRNHKVPPPEPRGAVRLRVIGSKHAFELNGPTACELISRDQYDAILNRLGPDPLRADADPETVWRRISGSRAAIGALLLNQSVLAGVGNVFRADALHKVGIHPDRPGNAIDRDEFDDLWQTLTEFLRIGVRYNRIITADAERYGKPPSKLNRRERLRIYKKQECIDCGGEVESWELGARKIFACPNCQV